MARHPQTISKNQIEPEVESVTTGPTAFPAESGVVRGAMVADKIEKPTVFSDVDIPPGLEVGGRGAVVFTDDPEDGIIGNVVGNGNVVTWTPSNASASAAAGVLDVCFALQFCPVLFVTLCSW